MSTVVWEKSLSFDMIFTGFSKNRHKKASKTSYKRLTNDSQNNNSCSNRSYTCFFDSLLSDHSLSPTERWRFVLRLELLFTNCDQMFTKKGPSELYVPTNACFTRRACVKERVKLMVEWWEMCYQWESDIQTCEIRFREIALFYKFVTMRTFLHRDISEHIGKILTAWPCVAICMQSFSFRLKFMSPLTIRSRFVADLLNKSFYCVPVGNSSLPFLSYCSVKIFFNFLVIYVTVKLSVR